MIRSTIEVHLDLIEPTRVRRPMSLLPQHILSAWVRKIDLKTYAKGLRSYVKLAYQASVAGANQPRDVLRVTRLSMPSTAALVFR